MSSQYYTCLVAYREDRNWIYLVDIMSSQYYCVCLVVYKEDNNNVFPIISFHEAASEDDAYTQALIRDYALDYLKRGYRIALKLIDALSTSICPYNSDSGVVYKIVDRKVTHLTINMQATPASFNQELKDLLAKYWPKDVDKL